MIKSLYIVTGASRGLGAAIAEQLLARNTSLLCLSRHASSDLQTKAQAAGAQLVQWQSDLADAHPVAAELARWLASFDVEALDRACLINNAGVISRIGPVDEDVDDGLSRALRVGLEAPLLLSAAFLRGTASWRAARQILNISSGLGRRAMAGSASYCAAKAGLDNLSRAMALDEAARPNGARIVSLAPGVIDTDMQVQLRGAEPSGFPEQANFVAMKTQGRLATASEAAQQVVSFLQRADFGESVIADVRQA